MGLEPTRPYEHRHLKPACLPIPARSHIILLRTLEHYTIRFSFVKREKREFLLLLMLSEADNHPNDEGDVENGDDQHEGGQHLDGGGDGIALKKKEPSAEEEQNDGNGHRDGTYQNIGKTQT